ncbi:double-strand break repair helicase AddA [Sphingomonas sp. ASV193]|uniref:double-strand break repair helicase AddA n=1 Tax=Sphingomonas sp. ASV193 TaxID=3144405 RepID=UPI0032E8F821
MSRRRSPLNRLRGDQRAASEPMIHAALSASAGTGKTQVLIARVLRLLLAGAAPESILCLTFTKAGAAEMANRLGDRLARWVRMGDAELGHDLQAIGEESNPRTRQRARRLFARVIEAPGGLRIQTIHSFAQTLLAAFPAEAGIAPGFEPIEGRAEKELARRTLATLAEQADPGLLRDIESLSLRLGEEGAESYLLAAGHAGDAFAEMGDPSRFEPMLRAVLEVPDGDLDDYLAAACHDDSFDCALLRRMAEANRAIGGKEGTKFADQIEAWLLLSPADRARTLDGLIGVVLTGEGTPRARNARTKGCDDYPDLCERLHALVGGLVALRRKAAFAAAAAAGLRAGSAFAAAWTEAKRAAAVADFDDLIRWARGLLAQPGIGEWIRFKLDQRTDHVLVDEAQDTNRDQWEIVDALVGEFFAGGPDPEPRHRTLFMVGDFKQAIYSFQGTDPREFETYRNRIKARADALEAAALAAERTTIPFQSLSISASFRSAQAVLDVVDATIGEIGYEAMGLPEPPAPHRAGRDRPGSVELWPPFLADDEGEGADGEEGWIAEPVRRYATAIARQVRDWLADPPLMPSTGAPLAPGDIMILLRSRSELAALIVARLFAEGVPVAGIDRLHLSKPLAVRDLMAAVGFAVQPNDDLNLASLLVSPLVGWSQEALFDLAHDRGAKNLWARLGERRDDTHAMLSGLLAMADYVTPARFLETILSGPIEGRRKLLARLGEAARDPIEELVSSALAFEREETASLDRFLAWFAGGEVEVKRDASAAGGAVRVMTVHGAKGLEAPLVLLADATFDPARSGGVSSTIDFPVAGREAPLVRPRKEERVEPFATLIDAAARRDLEEHWRLLYVAMTRAADRLVVAGLHPSRGQISTNSWHSRIAAGLASLGAEDLGGILRWAGEGPAGGKTRRPRRRLADPPRPEWLDRAAPAEAVPPRPLSPSALATDRDAAPPPSPALRDAARRGTLLHALFERLPDADPGSRHDLALGWLARAGVDDPETRAEIAEAACAVIADPRYAALFAPGALAEAPIVATLPDGRVIAGTVDRLRVEPDRVTLVDYKTGRSVPGGPDDVPASHRQQMVAYREALAAIFPGRRIEAALLYTHGPRLVSVDG